MVFFAMQPLVHILWFNATLHCCGLRHDMCRVVHVLFWVLLWALWVLPHWGPCWTLSAQEHRMDGVWGTLGVWGGDVGVC